LRDGDAEVTLLTMKRACLLTLCFVIAGTVGAEPRLRDGDFVAICGDSITEQKDYSVVIEDYFLMCQPAADLKAMQFGWGGETGPGFFSRMQNDVLRFRPTVATTCYGMNDGGYSPQTREKAKRYREAQQKIVRELKAAGVRVIVVGSPGCVDSDTFRKDPQQADMYNRVLADERDIAEQVAREEGVIFADVFDPMLNVMRRTKDKYGKEYHLAGADGVHPGHNGHLVMAYAFLKAMGCDGEIGTITADAGGGKAEASEGHKIVSCENGVIEVESTRYPFCFFGTPSSPDATSGVIEYLPFNQELNRLVLVVNGAEEGQKYRVTWGKVAKEFEGEELSRGVNLAAEFLENPFCDAFKKVDEAVRKQQAFETPMVKTLVHTLPQYVQAVPDERPALERVARKLAKQDHALMDASRAAVTPVRHAIKIEAVK